MKKIIDKRNYIILFIIIVLIIIIMNGKANIKTYKVGGHIITTVIYDKVFLNEDKVKKIYSGKEKIYKQNEKLLSLFKKMKIKNYIVNIDGNIIVGNLLSKISINKKDGSVLDIVTFKNKTLVNRENDSRFVSIICDDEKLAYILSAKSMFLNTDEALRLLDENKCAGLIEENDGKTTNNYFDKLK